MNLPRLRELAQKGLGGTLRPEEAKELFEALPEVFAALGPENPCPNCDGRGEYETDYCALCQSPKYTFCDDCAGTGHKIGA